jgi:hypothetical protein
VAHHSQAAGSIRRFFYTFICVIEQYLNAELLACSTTLIWSMIGTRRPNLIERAGDAIARLIQAQLSYVTAIRSLSTAAAGTAAVEPFIPSWVDVLLPPASAVQAAAQVKSVKHVSSAYSTHQLPAPRVPEVAVLGRSNVGKSSLVNYLLGSSSLAKVSATPGGWMRDRREDTDAGLISPHALV